MYMLYEFSTYLILLVSAPSIVGTVFSGVALLSPAGAAA